MPRHDPPELAFPVHQQGRLECRLQLTLPGLEQGRLGHRLQLTLSGDIEERRGHRLQLTLLGKAVMHPPGDIEEEEGKEEGEKRKLNSKTDPVMNFDKLYRVHRRL